MLRRYSTTSTGEWKDELCTMHELYVCTERCTRRRVDLCVARLQASGASHARDLAKRPGPSWRFLTGAHCCGREIGGCI